MIVAVAVMYFIFGEYAYGQESFDLDGTCKVCVFPRVEMLRCIHLGFYKH
jgi:hypothetical protein